MRIILASFLTLCLGFAMTGITASNASAAPQTLPALSLKQITSKTAPAATQVGYRGRCSHAYRKCRWRHGRGGDFRRCMRWRGCGYRGSYRRHHRRDHYDRCAKWRRACAENWGYGNNDYRGCLKYYDCY